MAKPSHPHAPGYPARSALLWTVLFAVFTLVRIAFHEMWRDELNAWIGPLDAPSLADLLPRLRYGGHGYVWTILLYVLTRMCPAPAGLLFLNAAIATATVWLVLRYAPLRPWMARLLVFGYFFAFEYAVVARPYSLGILACTAGIVLLTRERPRVLAAAACLALVANTTIYGLILAVAIAAAGGLRLWCNRDAGPAIRTEVAIGAALLCLACAVGVWCMVPPSDTGYAVPWHLAPDGDRIEKVILIPWRAFFPIPRPGLHFWNTNIQHHFPRHAMTLSVLTLLGTTWFLRRSAAALVCWALGAGGMLVFSYLKYIGSLRHHGYVLMAFLAAAWLAALDARRPGGAATGAWERRARTTAFAGLLALHLAACLYASVMDIRLPFSASETTAAWIRDNGLAHRLIIADRDSIAAPVLARLNHPRILYARGERTARMVIWDSERALDVPESTLVELVRSHMQTEPEPPVLLTSYPLTNMPTFLREATNIPAGIVPDEAYVIYLPAE